ncbi:MAG: glycosyltransferase [Rubrivivax sp.]|nr:glycosyltransferase [Rubrivivax sp.]
MPPSFEQTRLPGAPRLRLLLLTDEMEIGGSQRQIVNLARGLDPLRFEVTVGYFRNPSFFVDQLKQAGIRVVHLPKRGRVDLSFLRDLRRELREGRYHVVHAFAFSAELWSAVARVGLRGRQPPQLVSSIRGTYDWYSSLHWLLKRWVTHQSTRVVANSRMGAEFACRRMRLPATGIDVIYNGVMAELPAPDVRAALRATWQMTADEVIALFVGRLVDVKDVGTLLRAMHRLQQQQLPLRLVLCGDGPDMAALQAQAERQGLQQRVMFLGQRDDVVALIEAADLLVLPSRQEGLSNVILEAMRGGRPVVASRAGGNVELVEPERTGLLFEVGDDAALAAALRRLALDRGLRESLGRHGAERVRRSFAVGPMVAALARVYREAHGQPGRLRPASRSKVGGDVRHPG